MGDAAVASGRGVKVRSLEQRARQAEPVLRIAEWARQSGRLVDSTIAGTSMGATLPEGTPIVIDLSLRDHQPGTVVALLSGATPFAHRVVARGAGRARGYWITRGDALTVCDAPVEDALILGRVFVRDGETLTDPPPEPPRPFATIIVIALVRVLLAISPRLARAATRILSSAAGAAGVHVNGAP